MPVFEKYTDLDEDQNMGVVDLFVSRHSRQNCRSGHLNLGQSGFTLLELSTVVVIIGILALFSIRSFNSAIEKWQIRAASNAIQKQLILARTMAMINPDKHCGVFIDTSAQPVRTQIFFDDGNSKYDAGIDSLYRNAVELPRQVKIVLPSSPWGGVTVFRGDGSAKGLIETEINIKSRNGKAEDKKIHIMPGTGRVRVL